MAPVWANNSARLKVIDRQLLFTAGGKMAQIGAGIELNSPGGR
jgi:hypothetical protein